MPPARPVSGWITSTSSRSINSRSPKMVAMRSPEASGTWAASRIVVAFDILRRDRILHPGQLIGLQRPGQPRRIGWRHPRWPCRSIIMSISAADRLADAGDLAHRIGDAAAFQRRDATVLQDRATSGVLAWP